MFNAKIRQCLPVDYRGLPGANLLDLFLMAKVVTVCKINRFELYFWTRKVILRDRKRRTTCSVASSVLVRGRDTRILSLPGEVKGYPILFRLGEGVILSCPGRREGGRVPLSCLGQGHPSLPWERTWDQRLGYPSSPVD